MGTSVHSWVVYSVLMVIVALAAIFDHKNHRIPNWLSFSGWYLGPILHLMFADITAMSGSLLGLLLVFTISFPLFVLNWMGAGDVKLMTSVAALVGLDHALLFLASIFITGFVIGVVQLLLKGLLATFVRRYWMMLGMSLFSSRFVYVEPDVAQQKVEMPYAISIAIGTFVALCLL